VTRAGNILVVDDDGAIRTVIVQALQRDGHRLTTAATLAEAEMRLAAGLPDVLITDVVLPDGNGLDMVARLVAEHPGLPVIVLSARATSGEKVLALDAGADDYVTKPFGMDELLARIRVGVRRQRVSAELPGGGTVETADFTVDLGAKRVMRGGAPVRLTPTEWELLEMLIQHTGKLVPQKALLERVWGPGYETETHYLRVYLAQLRRKLEPDPAHPRYLHTEPGMGYRFESGT
jgi:two-component system KDP operon response regulator KdpE